ncbi:MAG: hypothetical protein AAF202_06725, partial [Pseudomonadota bacterium]
RQIQKKFLEAEKHIQKLKSSMDRSMEVASIFQDKIPHDEIIERQNTIKHVQAARMANQGCGVEEILSEIDLPREQVEFIAKVNKDQLMFDEEQLPAWVEGQAPVTHEVRQDGFVEEAVRETFQDQDLSLISDEAGRSFQSAPPQYESLKKLGDDFRQACQTFEEGEREDHEAPSWDKVEKVKETLVASPTFQKAKGMTSALLKGVSETLSAGEESAPESGSAELGIPGDFSEGQGMDAEREAGLLIANHAEEVSVVPSEPKKFGNKKQIVKDIEIKKVVFPQIDVTDNLS